ncbi:MAG: hypothetical protein AABZ08_09830 [Planctomycetota bacterium]
MKRLLLIVVVIAGIAGVAGWWMLRPTGITFLTDASTIRETATTAVVREVLWQPPTLLPESINSEGDSIEPRMSADGRTMYFVRGRPGGGADVYSCMMSGGSWSEPTSVDAVNSEYDELGPEISSDGGRFYFYSDRPGGIGGYDLWMSKKSEGEWQPPENLGNGVNSAFNEYGPAFSPDGKLLCFSSNRPRGDEARPSDDAWRATVREDVYQHDYDLYSVVLKDSGATQAQRLGAVNTSANEGSPTFSSVGDFLYFASDRKGGQGGFDLYRSRIVRGALEAATNLGSAVNTAANELDPSADLGGFALHFSSDRAAGDAAKRGQYQIYRTSSREVFHDVEWRNAAVDWGGLWREIGARLGWIVLALLVFLLLLALFRDAQRRKLSLLARCLIASLLVHALLMMMFNVIEVSTSVASYVRGRGGPVRVSTLAGGKGVSLAGQMRGQITESVTIAVPTMTVHRVEPRLRPAVESTPVSLRSEATPHQVFGPMVTRSPLNESVPRVALAAPSGILASLPLATPAMIQLPGDVQRRSESETGVAAIVAPTIADSPRVNTTFEIHTDSGMTASAIIRPGTANGGHEIHGGSLVVAGAIHESSVPSGVEILGRSGLVQATFTDAPVDIGLPGDKAGIRQSGGEAEPSAALPSIGSTTPAPIGSTVVGWTAGTSSDCLRPESRVVAGSTGSLVGRAVAGAAETTIVTSGTPMMQGVTLPDVPVEEALRLPTERAGPGVATTEVDAFTAVSSAVPGMPVRTSVSSMVGATDMASSSGSVMVQPESSGGTQGSFVTPVTTAGLTATSSLATPAPVVSMLSQLATITEPTMALPIEIAMPPALVTSTIESSVSDVFGRIEGRVTDADSGEALAGARIRIDVAGRTPLEVAGNSSGRFGLDVPSLPENFAVSASMDGYLPRSRNVEAKTVRGQTRRVHFRLQRESAKAVALEDSPEVHHLGNDAFEGAINSQFQRDSEGTVFSSRFELTADQLSESIVSAELELLAKGVQCPHKIRVNGTLLEARLNQSPPDGSFGVFIVPVVTDLLRAGENVLEIRAVSCRGDLDDFEFVNIQLKLFANPH